MAKAYWVVCYLSVTEPKHGKSSRGGGGRKLGMQGRGIGVYSVRTKTDSGICLNACTLRRLLTVRGVDQFDSERLKKTSVCLSVLVQGKAVANVL